MSRFWQDVLKAMRRDPAADELDRVRFELATLRRKVANIADAADRAREHMLASPVGVTPDMAELIKVFGTTASGLRAVLALPETGGRP